MARTVHPFQPVGHGEWCGECLQAPMDLVHDVYAEQCGTQTGGPCRRPAGHQGDHVPAVTN